MRLGVVYLAMVISVPMGAFGQNQWPWAMQVQPGSTSNSMPSVTPGISTTTTGGSPYMGNYPVTRADGSSLTDDGQVPIAGQTRPGTTTGAISFRHYVHQPAKAAKKNFEKAARAIEKEQHGEALDRLRDAVLADPEYFEAHLQAALVWIAQEQPAEALPHLEKALQIDSSSQIAQGLAAWALLRLDRTVEAELAARRSLQLGRNIPILEQLIEVAQNLRKNP